VRWRRRLRAAARPADGERSANRRSALINFAQHAAVLRERSGHWRPTLRGSEFPRGRTTTAFLAFLACPHTPEMDRPGRAVGRDTHDGG